MRNSSGLIVSLALSLLLSGCDDNVSAAWTDVLKKCVGDDQITAKLEFIGPSNTIGPGALWRKDSLGKLRLRFLIDRAIPDKQERNALFIPGEFSTCKGREKSSWRVNPVLLLGTGTDRIQGELAIDLSKAKSVAVGVTSWALDQIVEGPFETWLREHPDSGYVKDLIDVTNGSRVVMRRAVKVRGFSTTLVFSPSVGMALRPRYSSPTLSAGKLGVNLTSKWTNDTTLDLTSTKDIYIAAEFAELKDNRFTALGGGSIFKTVDPKSIHGEGHDELQ